MLGTPLDPWQEWAAIHAGEMLPDGRPRFRTVLILVARQNGKTLLAKVLTLYWLFIDQVGLVLATSTNRDYAKRVWREVHEQACANPILKAELGPHPVRLATGDETFTTAAGCEYKFAATNRRAGRSLTVHRLLLDELREHKDFSCWDSASKAMNAVVDGQIVAITNQGDDQSVVLDALRNPAVEYIETGQGDPRLGLFEWSAPQGAPPTSMAALAAANPNLGRRLDPDALRGDGMRAQTAGGPELAGYKTEVLCQRVHQLDPALDPDAWQRAGTDTPLDLAPHRRQVALCVDVSLAGDHATLAAAALINGKVHVEIVAAWDGYGCTKALRADLPDLIAQVRPRALGWFPAGPAAAVAADLADRGHRNWPPRRVRVDEIRGEVTAVCMGLGEQVDAGHIVHPNDDLLTSQVNGTQKLWRGDAWVFGRKGTTAVDGVYATAGAVHLARTLPPALAPLTVA